MVQLTESLVGGYFSVDGLDYPKSCYGIKYDNNQNGERAFTLYNVDDDRDVISSVLPTEVEGVSSWGELLTLVKELECLRSKDVLLEVKIRTE